MKRGFSPVLVLITAALAAVVISGIVYFQSKSKTIQPQTVTTSQTNSTPTQATSSSQTNETANWKIYISAKGNFIFNYPTDWNIDTELGFGTSKYDLDYSRVKKSTLSSFSVNAQIEPSEITYPFNSKDASIVTVAGEKAYYQLSGDSKSSNKTYGVKRNGIVYRIDLVWDKDDANSEKILDQILSTIKFTD